MSEREKNQPKRGHGGPGGGPGGPGGFGRPVEKAKDAKGTFKRLVQYMSPYRGKLLAIFLVAILSTVFSIVSPKIMGKATTKLFEGVMAKFVAKVPGAVIDFDYIARICLILIGLYLLSAFFTYITQFIMADVAQKAMYDLRQKVKDKLTRLPLSYYDARKHGEILSRVTNDIDTISTTLQQSLTQLITSVVTIVGILVMMLTISPVMTLIALVTLPVSAVITQVIAKRSQSHFIAQARSLGELNGHIEEMYTGHKIVKAFGREETSAQKFEEINEHLYQAGYKANFVSGIIMPVLNFVNNIGYVLICVVGGLFVARDRMNIGDVQAFISYMRQFTQPIVQTANIANVLQATIASAERVFEILDEKEEEQDAPAAISATGSVRGTVRFEQVNFGYKADAPLIEDMNIQVNPGQTVAIVGPTGAGKTTLVNLLMRFYEVGDGSITIDGRNIRDWKRGSLRSLFGMVLQDTWLFNGTIRDNIAYGRKNATEEEITAAAKAAHADRFIRTLPEGYNTILNEDASNISQGQRQLLTIARAILADPSILILDEATSSVDTRTEVYIQKAMTRLMQGRTSFVIAHRLSTIRDADLILVMNHGKVIEKGTHQELLAAGGFYADLYNSQFTTAGAGGEVEVG
ncbi:MAG: putative transporter ATP-binding protein [Paenibacillaceae bacterium]|jgi:ATP-binding cassette subfamily B protein|nr:putative transporter ATP-binding protein [Paenibacillaceae bacterium]